MAAVKQDGTALKYTSGRLRSDVPFCIECAKKNPESIAYFEGEAKDLFQTHHNDIVAVEQQSANEALLLKLSKNQTFSPSLFKRNLLNA
jgi:hypothetical protein